MTTGRGLLRLLHFIGLAMFLGSIFGHIALGSIPGAESDPRTIVLLRTVIVHTTRALTAPGLILLIVTGVWMTVSYHGGFFRARWLTVHQVLAVLILLNTVLILRPLGVQLLDMARGLQTGEFDLSTFHHTALKEITFGPINLVLTLAAMGVAIYRPRFLQRAPAKRALP